VFVVFIPMSEMSESAKEFARSLKKLISATVKEAEKVIEKTAPQLSELVTKLLNEVESTATNLLKDLERRTEKEQLEILRAYRSILKAQLEKVETRIKQLEQNLK